MFQKIECTILLLLMFHLGYAQEPQLSKLSKLSLLTAGTGQDLAAKFGHSGIRLQDPAVGIDVVYGYGTYNFEDPNFYLNFTRGKLDYMITRQPFGLFEKSYIIEKRWIKEQELNLDLEQRKNIIGFLETNLLPQNRLYKYDFLFENCATKIPEVFEKNLGDALQFDYSHLEERYTFRQLIHQNLNVNSWSNFGIDLALGSVIDREATPYEHLFLPIYVYEQLKHTTVDGKPIVTKESLLLDIPTQEDDTFFLFTPVFWLALLMVIVFYISYTDVKHNSRTRWIDVLLFSLTGIAGCIILFLWFLTDHDATKGNYNILWAFAPNLIVALYLVKKAVPKWLVTYLSIVLALLVISVILWLVKIQMFSLLLIFVLLAVGIRYLFLLYHFKKTA
ncbi:DUF4105 domain-containing protein [Maribacter chungangensis]|uniref:DUF4105 domain-containing protein n=1 Tax=Maribacter chungangensis TaxID=1069117 RepID=A0ABW3B4M1_9FLAO